MLQMNAPQSAGATVAALVQSLAVKTDGATVTVGLGIPETMLESLVQMRSIASGGAPYDTAVKAFSRRDAENTKKQQNLCYFLRFSL
jgi:hypothetical protein